jgi:hypothetical protein
MDEIVPRKIVEMAISTGKEETSGNGIRIFGRLITAGTTTALMYKASPLRPESVFLDLE